MSCAGIRLSTSDSYNGLNHTQRVIDLAIKMIKISRDFTTNISKKIIIKIGIHYGPVIAGVIGYHKPQFSLIGDTVNTTSRICSTGMEGIITISNEAFQNINGKYKNLHFKERKVTAKGKGEITTYQIILNEEVNFEHIKELKLMSKLKRNFNVDTTIFLEKARSILKDIKLKKQNQENKQSNQRIIFNEIFKKPSNISIHTPINKKNSLLGSQNNSLIENNSLNLCSKLKLENLLDNNDLSKLIIEKKDDHVLLNENGNILHYLKSPNFQNDLIIKKEKFVSVIDEIEHYPGKLSEKEMQKNYRDITNNQKANDDLFEKIKIKKKDNSNLLIFDEKWLSIKKETTNDVRSDFYTESKSKLERIRRLMIIFSLIYLVNSVRMIINSDIENISLFIVFRTIIIILNISFLLLFTKKKTYSLAIKKYICIYNFMVITELLCEHLATKNLGLENILELILFFLIQSQSIYITFMNMLIFLFYIFFYAVAFILIENNDIEIVINVIFVIFILIWIIYSQRIRMLNDYQHFNAVRLNSMKKLQQNNLIINLLPSHILEKFLAHPNEQLNLTDEFEDVTILFADIAGFTKFSSSVSAQQVVSVLQDLFTEFDKACLENCVYKLYTIGDCYVVIGLIDPEDRNIGDEALNVVNMGLQMIKIIENVKKRVCFEDINMRIGIHTVL